MVETGDSTLSNIRNYTSVTLKGFGIIGNHRSTAATRSSRHWSSYLTQGFSRCKARRWSRCILPDPNILFEDW